VAGKPETEGGSRARSGSGNGAGLAAYLSMKARCLLLVIGTAVYACSHPKPTAEALDPRFPECPSCSTNEKLYYFADTSFTRHDSLFIVNTKLDTTVVETGIFTYPQHSFPVCTPQELVALIRQGVRAETNGKPDQATSYYQEAVSFYQNDWLKRKAGFENGGFSDLNDYFAANVNIVILVSHAFEKLGRLPEACAALAPFLANVEAEDSKIQLRYIQLCIQQYGKAATKKALDTAGRTAHRLPDAPSENDRWRVDVFGAALGVDDFNTTSLSPNQAQALVQKQPFYALVQ
jgi:hypothetical protein